VKTATRKWLITILGCVVLLIVVGLLAVAPFDRSAPKGKYPSCRDTYRSFGDGRFQMMTTPGQSRRLVDVRNQEELLSKIDSWGVENEQVFFKGVFRGQRRLLVLDLEDNEILEYDEDDDAAPGAAQG
jgi:hypothetical protein